MFFLLGARELFKTVTMLSLRFLDRQSPPGRDSLRRAYVRFLEDYQPHVPSTNELNPEFVCAPDITQRLATLFNAESRLDDLHKRVIDERRLDQGAWGLLASRHAFTTACAEHPEFGEALSFQTKLIFSARSSVSGGGTTSAAIGVIWADIRKKWSVGDMVEFLVHENTHTSMFLDELRYRHYEDIRTEILDPEHFAISAVLGKPRPIDKVLHSLVVSTEVLSARDAWLGHPAFPRLHPTTDAMLRSTLETVASLRTTKARILPRARELIDMCDRRVKAIQRNGTGRAPNPVWTAFAPTFS